MLEVKLNGNTSAISPKPSGIFIAQRNLIYGDVTRPADIFTGKILA